MRVRRRQRRSAAPQSKNFSAVPQPTCGHHDRVKCQRHVAQPSWPGMSRPSVARACHERWPGHARQDGSTRRNFRSRCSKAIHAEQADGDWAAAPPLTRYRQCVPVDIEWMTEGLGAARKHQRVLRASPCCICAGFLSVLRRRSHATHPFPAGCRKFVARRSDFEG
jgi:hypothetical protein